MHHTEQVLSTTISYSDRWRITLGGELDADARSTVQPLAEALAESGEDAVDFDLSGITFADSAGWAVVCEAAATLRSAGMPARIVEPSAAVCRLTGLLQKARSAA
ncbi:MAG TPA: STAS domain-containing protein [Acidimicrobiales bacterium]|nr:STAS domain-containing protein [Acidimicrobiales bacterium]